MNLSFKPQHLKRYREIAALVIKYGRREWLQQFSDRAELFDDLPASDGYAEPEELPSDLERMGPAFVKLGQILSSRADLLPKPYLDALSRLQDKIQPFPYEQVEEIVASELKVKVSK